MSDPYAVLAGLCFVLATIGVIYMLRHREYGFTDEQVDAATTTEQRLMKDSASLALMLVALGKSPDFAWTYALDIQDRLTGRSYSALLSLDELRDIAEAVR